MALSDQVWAMHADFMITIVFCLEVFLFGLAAAVVVARGVREANREVAAENERDRGRARAEATGPPRPSATANELKAGDASQLASGRARRALRDVRS